MANYNNKSEAELRRMRQEEKDFNTALTVGGLIAGAVGIGATLLAMATSDTETAIDKELDRRAQARNQQT